MLREENYYDLLGLTRQAGQEEIRSAYFEAARRLHPDTNPDPDALELFLKVQNAYSVLANPETRSGYDAALPQAETASPAVAFIVQTSRSSLSRSDEAQLVYALIDLTSIPDPAFTATPPLNICLVIDRSTSMQGQRMDTVKASTLQLIKQMRQQDIISIVTYSDRAEVLIPACRVSDLAKLQSRINMIQPSGGTEIYYGLEAGIVQLRANKSANYINHLILLTDGRTYGDEPACLKLAEQAAAEGIGISGLGIGSEWNDIFLDRLTSFGGGSSMYVAAATDLSMYLEEKCKSLGKLYAERVVLEFEKDPGVKVNYAFRMLPDAAPLSTQSPIQVGNIGQFRSLRILLEFLVEPLSRHQNEVILASGTVKMEIPTWQVPSTRLRVNIRLPIKDGLEQDTPPSTILQAMSKLSLYRLQERARAEVEKGNTIAATRHLQYLATNLLSQGQRELAQTVLAEAQTVGLSRKFSKEGDKQIKYGTRALMLPMGPERNGL